MNDLHETTRAGGLRQLYAETRALELLTSAARHNHDCHVTNQPRLTMLARHVASLQEQAAALARRLRELGVDVPGSLAELASLSRLERGGSDLADLASAREAVGRTSEALAQLAGQDRQTQQLASEQARAHRRVASILRAVGRASTEPPRQVKRLVASSIPARVTARARPAPQRLLFRAGV